MADAVTTVTEWTNGPVKRIKYTFTSASAGSATQATANKYNGKILWVVSDPGATAPTAAWDFTITDVESLDVCDGGGANRSATATEYITEANTGAVCNSLLTLNVTNAGDQKTGTVYVFIR